MSLFVLSIIVFPFGKFEMQRLPMGLCNSPDIFQEKMSELFDGLDFVRTYIDDLLTLTKGTFEDHLEKLERVLFRLKESGLKVNAKKSFFAKNELECLGCWIAREGIKPLPDKAKAILALDALHATDESFVASSESSTTIETCGLDDLMSSLR